MRGWLRLVMVSLGAAVVMIVPTYASAQDPGSTGVSVTTWQADNPSTLGDICTGCVYRTGENLSESKIVNPIDDTTFGQICSAGPLTGQIYGQPLVATTVYVQGQYRAMVYVVTQNDYVYGIDGTNCNILLTANLLNNNFVGQPTMSPVDCSHVGGHDCLTIAPNVGVIGAPVIVYGAHSGTLYVVAYMQSGTYPNLTYYHFLHALDIKTLNEGVGNERYGAPIQILPTTACPSGNTPFSQIHIQRPALLYGGDGIDPRQTAIISKTASEAMLTLVLGV
jgi:hypothetical protein